MVSRVRTDTHRTAAAHGIVLINTGSPKLPEPDAVRAYLREFLMDASIRPLPAPLWSALLSWFILPKRSQVSAEKYRSIWGDEGSPLVAQCESLATRVAAELAHRHADRPAPPVRSAMLYGEPSLVQALSDLRDAGCRELVAIPLYPLTSTSTTGAAERALAQHLHRMDWAPRLRMVRGYGQSQSWVGAVAASIASAGYNPADDHLLFSFHAVPLADERKGDGYVHQAMASAHRIAMLLDAPSSSWEVAFQSPFEDGRRWSGPFTRPRIEELAKKLDRRLVVCCPGFSIDCLETLYDVEQGFRRLFLTNARQHATTDFLYVPCLNDSTAHGAVIADLADVPSVSAMASDMLGMKRSDA